MALPELIPVPFNARWLMLLACEHLRTLDHRPFYQVAYRCEDCGHHYQVLHAIPLPIYAPHRMVGDASAGSYWSCMFCGGVWKDPCSCPCCR